MQYRLADELALDQPSSDRADLAPRRLDRDLRVQFLGRNQLGQQTEANARPLNAHQLVKQGQATQSRSAGREEFPAVDLSGARFGDAERYACAVWLQHAERSL